MIATNRAELPVVLPAIVIRPDAESQTLAMTVNGQPVRRPIQQRELGALLSHVINRHGRPVRVEVHNPDGTIHADILTPPHHTDETTRPASTPQPVATKPAVVPVDTTRLDLGGFLPGEPVHLASVVATHPADRQGRLTIPLPRQPRLDRGRLLIVIGARSGNTMLCDRS